MASIDCQSKQENNKPVPVDEAALARMKAAKSKDTKPEIQLRSLLHRKGLRYRIDVRPIYHLNRRADIVFRATKVAVFVDGCFWHGCPEHGTWPKANAEFWEEKIKRNRERDSETNKILEGLGWTVQRVWEHEDMEIAAENIYNLVTSKKVE